MTDETLSGTVVLAFTIDPHGAVSSATFVKGDPKLDAVGACMARDFTKLSFPVPVPVPEGGALEVTFPIVLESTIEGPTGRGPSFHDEDRPLVLPIVTDGAIMRA